MWLYTKISFGKNKIHLDEHLKLRERFFGHGIFLKFETRHFSNSLKWPHYKAAMTSKNYVSEFTTKACVEATSSYR